MTDDEDADDAELAAHLAKAGKIGALAAELCGGDTSEMLLLLLGLQAQVDARSRSPRGPGASMRVRGTRRCVASA
jgi:hypothetical protein